MVEIIIFFITISLIYYLKLIEHPNKKVKKKSLDVLTNPIYQSKDILLQSNLKDLHYFVVDKPQSIWTKLLIFVIVSFVITTPLYILFGIEYFL